MLSPSFYAIVASLCVPLTLVFFHWILFLALRHPPPLVRRTQVVALGRALVVCAGGVIAAYLGPACLFLSSYLTEGTRDTLRLESVPDGPAANAGVLEGDLAVRVNEQAVKSFQELKKVVAASEGPVALDVLRGQDRTTILIDRGPTGLIGVRPIVRSVPFSEAMTDALTQPATLATGYVAGTLNLVRNHNPPAIVDATSLVSGADPKFRWRMTASMASVRLIPISAIYILLTLFDFRARRADFKICSE